MKNHFSSATFIASLLLISPLSFANPQLDHVAAGEANIEQSPGQMVIHQASDKAILNWHSFNIDANEKVHFQQPQGGVALNRISPAQGASQIYGSLTSTGQLILINGAGVHFGPNAHVDVGSLIVSATSDISNQNFAQGNYIFDQSLAQQGSVINEGTIHAADYGLVALVGTSVINHGLIQAELGKVVLGSADHFTLSIMEGGQFDGLLTFSIDTPVKNSNVNITNTGKIIADGGQVLIAAAEVSNVLDNVINLDGIIQANAVSEHNGSIEIFQEITDKYACYKHTDVNVTGKLQAAGGTIVIDTFGTLTINNEISTASSNKGGDIHLIGDNTIIKKGAKIDSSGALGGGDIDIGYMGYGTKTFFEEGSILSADALINGDGGFIYAEGGDTRTYGFMSSRGGAQGGDGGHIYLVASEKIIFPEDNFDLSAPHGKNGSYKVAIVW